MKFLQIKQNGKPLESPRILEMGIDFDFINNNCFFSMHRKISHGTVPKKYTVDIEVVGYTNHCYESRPLIEIDGFCEFDIVLLGEYNIRKSKDTGGYVDSLGQPTQKQPQKALVKQGTVNTGCLIAAQGKNEKWLSAGLVNLGSIFLPENAQKYPKLYEQALEIINERE